MFEVAIQSIVLDQKSYQPVVVLKEKSGERYLPIWIGSAEANAIAIKIQGTAVPRPLSHDLLGSVIETLGASIESTIINEVRDDTFYASLILNTEKGQINIDCRPSDALALAIRASAPIFVEDTVLDKAGVLIDKETGQTIPQQTSERKDVSEEELNRLSAFTDFINTLDMDNFGEGKKGENEDI